MVSLVDIKETQKIHRWRVRGGASLLLPKGCVEVVALADDGAFAGVERLGKGFEVDEAAGEFQVGIGDRDRRVL